MKRSPLKRKKPLRSTSSGLERSPLKRKAPVKRKRSKPRKGRERDPEYLAWIRSLPCLVPGCRETSTAHHYGKRGKGMKSNDRESVPLCFHHHIEWFHTKGHLPNMTPAETRDLFAREGERLRAEYEEMEKKTVTKTLLTFGLLLLTLGCSARAPEPPPSAKTQALLPAYPGLSMSLVTVDTSGPSEPWGKATGDVDGDGLEDLIVQGNAGGGLVWYEAPSWTKHTVVGSGAFRTDVEVADVDQDGSADFVTLSGSGLVWIEQDGTQHVVASGSYHDVEVGDMDGDGLDDLVVRNQTPFAGDGNFVHVFVQTDPSTWTQHTLNVPHGEGLLLVDVDADGDLDPVLNDVWLENDGTVADGYPQHTYGASYDAAAPAFGDLNGDGRGDLLIAPSEAEGQVAPLVWFEAPADRTDPWVEHVIEPSVEAVLHSAGIADFNGDGRLDVAVAEMSQSDDEDEVVIYLNLESDWSRNVIDTNGSHNVQILDANGDGLPDLFGANWRANGRDEDIKLWLNQSTPLPVDQWAFHVVGVKPDAGVFTFTGDLNGDGLPDILSGDRWFANPGDPGGTWTASVFGGLARNAVFADDNDGDGDLDVLASHAAGQGSNGSFAWARNDGGTFTVFDGVSTGAGDFLQGIAPVGGGYALSWHQTGNPVELLTVPSDPTGFWPLTALSASSQDEALSVGDLDGDGDEDLFQGSQWLRNDGASWTVIPVATFTDLPDRNVLSDIDGDGDLDAVVGFEGTSVDLVWLESPADPEQPWTVHVIASGVGGGYSLDVGDIDRDGDPDVVLGEHQGANRLLVFQNDGAGVSWTQTVVPGGSGIDHHDSSRLVDLDLDGDLDIVGGGWNDYSVYVWENLAIDNSAPPPPPEVALVAHWTLDDASGADETGNHPGTVNGATPAAGQVDGALSFDGSDDYVDAGAFDVEGAELTIAMWFNADSFNAGWSMDNRLLSKAASTSGADHYWMISGIRQNNQPHLRFRLKTDGTTDTLIGTGQAIGLNAWHHVAAVYDGSEMRLYLDGALVGSMPKTGDLTQAPGVAVNIGRNPDGFGEFDGELDDVRIYARALSAAEIAEVMDPSTPPPPNVPPVASFTATPSSGEVPLGVAFDASASSDSDGSIVSYAWDFGDGTTGTGVTATHNYAASGTFVPTLTVTDNDAATDQDTATITATDPPPNQLPTASFVLTCTVDGSASSDPDGSIASWSWDFGGGNTATGPTPSFLLGPGTSNVTLVVVDNDGDQDELTRNLVIP